MFQPTYLFYAVSCLLLGAVYQLYPFLLHILRRTALRGPRASNFVFGSRDLFLDPQMDDVSLYENWASQYGSVFQIPAPFGSRKVVLCDPKAVAHFYSLETIVYGRDSVRREQMSKFIGKGLLYAEKEDHKRQRKAMSPAFSNAAIRSYTSVFFDSAFKIKSAWDSLFDSSATEEVVLDVQNWMNRASLDSIGIAGFSHDFKSLLGEHSPVIEVFESFGKVDRLGTILFILAPFLPLLKYIPTKMQETTKKFNKTVLDISNILLERSKQEKKESGEITHDASRSIIDILIEAEYAEGRVRLSEREIRDQIMVLILAGYETTSISLSWALVELATRPEMQAKLRDELSRFSGLDSSYEELTNEAPYLDSVMREVLRLHPAVVQTSRMANEDDVLPLSSPLRLANGKTVTSVFIAKGETVLSSIKFLNMASSIWGDDAREFIPERWIDEKGIPDQAKKNPGYHHLMTFVDGQRTCIGRQFAIAEFKAVLSVLVRSFSFSLRDGPSSKFEVARTILPRPKLVGEKNIVAPLRIRRL